MKKRGVFLIGFFLLAVYYFLFPRPSGSELVLAPLNVTNLRAEDQRPSPLSDLNAGEGYPVRSATVAGFVTQDFQVQKLYRGERLAVAEGWLAQVENGQMTVYSSDNRVLFRLPTDAFPVSLDNRLYSYDDGRGELSEIDPENGNILWKRTYLSPITVLDAASGRTLVGLLDGRVFVINREGADILEYRPGGSRVEAIYGASLSSDGKQVALISGLDPQRFVLLDERKNGFRPIAHHDTETDFRRSVSIGFVQNNQRILHEGFGEICSTDLEGNSLADLDFLPRLTGWIDDLVPDSLLLLGVDSQAVSLKLLTGADATIYKTQFSGSDAWIRQEDNLILLSVDGRLLVIETVIR